MKDSFKIRITARQAPVSFVALSILPVGDEMVIQLPLMKRKELLQQYDGEGFIEVFSVPINAVVHASKSRIQTMMTLSSVVIFVRQTMD